MVSKSFVTKLSFHFFNLLRRAGGQDRVHIEAPARHKSRRENKRFATKNDRGGKYFDVVGMVYTQAQSDARLIPRLTADTG